MIDVIVCGGRYYRDRDRVFEVLDQLESDRDWVLRIIEGGARGADQLAWAWADRMRRPHVCVPAEWKRWGGRAGSIRNERMLAEHPNVKLVVAFPGGRGTADMVARAKAKGIAVMEVDPSPVRTL